MLSMPCLSSFLFSFSLAKTLFYSLPFCLNLERRSRIMAQIWTILSNLYSIAGPCVMLLYPLYASVEAIESPTKVDDEQWLAYWIIYSFLTLFEMVAEPLLSWIPIWYTVKLIFVTWLVLPQLRGSAFIYNKFVREQLRLYGYGGHKADKQVTKPSSPSKGRNKFLGLARSKKGE